MSVPAPDWVSDPRPEITPPSVRLMLVAGANAPAPSRATARFDVTVADAASLPPPDKVRPPASLPRLPSEETWTVPADMAVPPE